jgi:RimJ/RimL family protein N-acetyltransferase/ketosteroid isomerase-like protein
MSGRGEAMDRLADQVREALNTADLDALAELLDPAVRWGPPGHPVPPGRSRAEALARYRRGRDIGARARVTETLVAGDKILVGLKVTNPARVAARAGAGEASRWQVLTVGGDGRITAITAFPDREQAEIYAGLAPPRPAPPDAIQWAAPPYRLADNRIGLRLPGPDDAAVLHEYATRDGGLDGGWVPLPEDATLADCKAVVGDWLAGWRNERSFHGPVLIIAALGEQALAGVVGLTDRGGRTAELSYGVAPERRGRGYAARAARLAAQWLLDEHHADLVELRIAPDNIPSQRTALAAGFTPTGAVLTAAKGITCDDLRFVRQRPTRPG